MPDNDPGLRSPAALATTQNDENEIRQSFSTMINKGVLDDSFMGSVGCFMTDEEFFEFKDIYDEYQNTPDDEKKNSASKLFDSFSDLVTRKKSPSPRKAKTAGNDRLTNIRKELRLDEMDDEQSRATQQTSPSSFAQESTVSDASAYRRGFNLKNLGANPLDVSFTSFFTEGDDEPEHETKLPSKPRPRKVDDSFRTRRVNKSTESRNKLNDIPETPRSRARRYNSSAKDGDLQLSTKSTKSKILMTPIKESERSGSRSRSRGRTTTPNRQRSASISPVRVKATTMESFRRQESTKSPTASPRKPGLSQPIRDSMKMRERSYSPTTPRHSNTSRNRPAVHRKNPNKPSDPTTSPTNTSVDQSQKSTPIVRESTQDSPVQESRETVTKKHLVRKQDHQREKERPKSAGRGRQFGPDESPRRARSRSAGRRGISRIESERSVERFVPNKEPAEQLKAAELATKSATDKTTSRVTGKERGTPKENRETSPKVSESDLGEMTETIDNSNDEKLLRKGPSRSSRGGPRRTANSDDAPPKQTNEEGSNFLGSQRRLVTRMARGGVRQSVSSDDMLPINSRNRRRRPPSRHESGSHLTSSRHSVESHGSFATPSVSESIISVTETIGESSTNSQRRPSRGRARPEVRGRERVTGGSQRSRSTGPSTRSCSVSGRSPFRGNQGDDHASGNQERPKTPTQNRREDLAAMRAKKVTPATPQPVSKPLVGMARVKELNRRKVRSSSAPRPTRRTDDEMSRSMNQAEKKTQNSKSHSRHSSYASDLRDLRRIRRPKPTSEGDLASVQDSVQTWDPSRIERPRQRQVKGRPAGTGAEPNSEESSRIAPRHRNVERPKVPVRRRDGLSTTSKGSMPPPCTEVPAT